MKIKTTNKVLKNTFYRIITSGYGDLQSLLRYKNCYICTANVNGWRADYYIHESKEHGVVLIGTGYAPIDNSGHYVRSWELDRKYNDLAQDKTEKQVNKLIDKWITSRMDV